MATIVIVTHEFDVFTYRPREGEPVTSPYLLFDVLVHLEKLGHACRVTRGPNPLKGDAALLHVDATIVGEEYLALRDHYPLTFNFGTGDISKRRVSRLLLEKGDSWQGRVIVKGDLNTGGHMEQRHNARANRAGHPLPHPAAPPTVSYRVLDRIEDVGEEVWSDPALVVERFLAEPDEDGGFVLRTWVFMGKRERCTRTVGVDPIVKASGIIRYEPVAVPPELRAERERLNFDYGKFDFVMHEGRAVVLDTNRTPGVADAIAPMLKAGALNLAEGLDEMLRAGG